MDPKILWGRCDSFPHIATFECEGHLQMESSPKDLVEISKAKYAGVIFVLFYAAEANRMIVMFFA